MFISLNKLNTVGVERVLDGFAVDNPLDRASYPHGSLGIGVRNGGGEVGTPVSKVRIGNHGRGDPKEHSGMEMLNGEGGAGGGNGGAACVGKAWAKPQDVYNRGVISSAMLATMIVVVPERMKYVCIPGSPLLNPAE